MIQKPTITKTYETPRGTLDWHKEKAKGSKPASGSVRALKRAMKRKSHQKVAQAVEDHFKKLTKAEE